MKDFFNDLKKELTPIENQEDFDIIDIDNEPELKPKPTYNPEKNTDYKDSKQEMRWSNFDRDFNAWSFKNEFMTNFPKTNFYLPHLREENIRIINIWWNNELWKNMTAIQSWNEVILLDAWVSLSQKEILCEKITIPDISALINIKSKIKAVVLSSSQRLKTWGISHIFNALGRPTIITTKEISKLVRSNSQINIKISEIKEEEKMSIWNFDITLLWLNKENKTNLSVFIETNSINVFYAWNSRLEIEDENCNCAYAKEKISQIKEKWVDVLMIDSWNCLKKSNISVEKEFELGLKKILEKNKNSKIFLFSASNCFDRLSLVFDLFEKQDKQIFLNWKEISNSILSAKDIWLIESSKIRKFNNSSNMTNSQVVLSGSDLWEEIETIRSLVSSSGNLKIQKWDTVIIPKNKFAWMQRKHIEIINMLIDEQINVLTNDFLSPIASSNPTKEENKFMIKELSPSIVFPIWWDNIMKNATKNIALEAWIEQNKVILSKNGEINDLDKNANVFKSNIRVPVQNIIIDGYWVWVANSHVVKARDKMMNAWVITITFPVDKKTRAIIGQIKLETRGFVYLEEVRQIHRVLIKKSRHIYENTIMDVPEIEDKDLIKIIKTDLESFLIRNLNREPMVIPTIISI